MRAVKSVTETGTSSWVPVTPGRDIGIGCKVTGTVNYTVEYTYDDVLTSSATPTAFSHATIAAKTANFDGSITTPVSAVRLKVNSGTGTVVMTVLQSDISEM